MEIQSLRLRSSNIENIKLVKAINRIQRLIVSLNMRGMSSEIIAIVNTDIKRLNAFLDNDRKTTKAINKVYSKVLKLIENELKLVTKNHYRNLWMVLGMCFGIPFGTIFSTVLNNYGFIGIGLPIGMAVGIAYGTTLDKKAEKDGRQLDVICDSEFF